MIFVYDSVRSKSSFIYFKITPPTYYLRIWNITPNLVKLLFLLKLYFCFNVGVGDITSSDNIS